MEKDFLNNLRHFFKLNLYEAKVWTALLSRGVSTAGELAEISDVPRSRTYDVLESLEKKGFISLKTGKPIKYLAVEPREVVDRVKKFVHIEAVEHAKRLDSTKGNNLVKELELLHKNGVAFVDASDLSTSVKGRQNLQMQIETMVKNADKDVLIVTSASGIIRKKENLVALFQSINKKGVKARIAVPVTKESADAVKELMPHAEIRHLNKPDSRFCVVDNKEVLFMLMNDAGVHPTNDSGVWVNSPFFAQAMTGMFELAWKDMEPAEKQLKKL